MTAKLRSDPDLQRCSHAGGVVYRKLGQELEYLLIRARHDAGEWVLPKGHIEEGESARDTAEREVKEEAGVRAQIVAPLGKLLFDGACAEMFLMKFIEAAARAPERQSTWLDISAALRTVAFTESRELLTAAHAIAKRQR